MSVKSFYGIVNRRDVIPVYTPIVWKIHIPPRIHIFVWLLVNNKLLTRYNLSKQRHVDDMSCLLCSENKAINYLVLECVVAKAIWNYISDILGVEVSRSFDSIAKWWINEKKNSLISIFSFATLWCIWTFRDEMCFQALRWPGGQESAESNWYNDQKLEGIVLGQILKFVGPNLDASRSKDRRAT